MGRWRVILAVAGILLGLFGVGRLVTEIPSYSLKWLAVWLIAALLIHDGILSPWSSPSAGTCGSTCQPGAGATCKPD